MTTYTEQLEKQGKKINNLRKLPPKKKPVPSKHNEINIDLLLSQKRIRVRFKFDPGYEMGKLLTDFGFQWLIGQPIYEYDDTLETRKFLNSYLDAQLELDCFEEKEKEPLKLEVRDISPKEKEKTPKLEVQLHPDFEKYQMQVNRLMDTYNLDSKADLMVLAVESLYKVTFSN